jgi:hypothetical protein
MDSERHEVESKIVAMEDLFPEKKSIFGPLLSTSSKKTRKTRIEVASGKPTAMGPPKFSPKNA